MIQLDQQLLMRTRGQIGDVLETAISEINIECHENHSIFGELLPLSSILFNRGKAASIIMSTVKKYWGNVDLFLQEVLQDTTIDLETANDRLHAFLSSKHGEQSIFDFLLVNKSLSFNHIIYLVFGKEINIPHSVGGLTKFYLTRIGGKFLLHIIYNQHSEFWYMLFAKKIYSIFMQVTLNEIHHATDLMKQLKKTIKSHYTLNQSVVVMNELIEKIDYENPRSFRLKELHLLNVIAHYNGGKRHHRKIKKLISEIFEAWGNGRWALTEKEVVLLKYILAVEAANQNDNKKVIEYGNFLIGENHLNNHAIELLLEYSDVLPNIKPEPNTLVKCYHKNYLEQIFYIMINALVQNEQYTTVIRLLKDHEIASCSTIYQHLNTENDENTLHLIEATVQKDIAFIVDKAPHHVMKSIEVWLQHYRLPESHYYEIAMDTSSHVCNILMALFATEQFELFEKLMEVYQKYLKVDDHFNKLREFVSDFVK